MASERNEAIRRIAGHINAYEFFEDGAPCVDGAARACGVRGMLNRAPGCRLSAGIRIIPGSRHGEGRIGLAKSSADAWK